MVPGTKVIMKMERRRGRADSRLPTVAITRALLSTTKSVDLDTITGLTANLTQGTGARTKWTVMEN